MDPKRFGPGRTGELVRIGSGGAVTTACVPHREPITYACTPILDVTFE